MQKEEEKKALVGAHKRPQTALKRGTFQKPDPLLLSHSCHESILSTPRTLPPATSHNVGLNAVTRPYRVPWMREVIALSAYHYSHQDDSRGRYSSCLQSQGRSPGVGGVQWILYVTRCHMRVMAVPRGSQIMVDDMAALGK